MEYARISVDHACDTIDSHSRRMLKQFAQQGRSE